MKLEIKNTTQFNFDLSSQEALLVSGPNGCGKTTFLKTLCGLRELSDGEFYLDNVNVTRNRHRFLQQCLYIGHQNAIKTQLTVAENVHMFASFSECQDGADPYTFFGLMPFMHHKCEQLSQGQKRKVALSKLLLSKAAVWLLDEPFTALDEQSCRKTAELMAQHVQNGGMLIYTSHQTISIPNIQQKQLTLPMRDPSCLQ